MAKYLFEEIIRDSRLNISKAIKAENEAELNKKIKEQRIKWDQLFNKKNEHERIEHLKKEAEERTNNAKKVIKAYETILISALKSKNKLIWDQLYDKKKYKQFLYIKNYPTYEEIAEEIGVPQPNSLAEFFFDSIRRTRIEKENEAKQILKERINLADKKEEVARNQFEKEKREFEKKQVEENKNIDTFKRNFELGKQEEVQKYIEIILNQSPYFCNFRKLFDTQFFVENNTLIVNYNLPSPNKIPFTTEYRYSPSKKAITTIKMKEPEFKRFYESVVCQITLRTIYEIFNGDYSGNIKVVVFNGLVEGIDKKTGNKFTSCIISCSAPRDIFETFNLSLVNPKECIRGLKGIYAGSLIELAPVKPIMRINKDDSRFVESKEILSKLNSSQNLATMPWEDFEHLVRELFEMIFSREGADVKVTQASRDGGIDAIAFDPDPIKGGKFVIQAKRYNLVVPPTAVRDLYGTIIHEGASKGILVTTSHFGNDSIEYVKDKPISLVNGQELMYLFQKFGYKVHVQTNHNKEIS